MTLWAAVSVEKSDTVDATEIVEDTVALALEEITPDPLFRVLTEPVMLTEFELVKEGDVVPVICSDNESNGVEVSHADTLNVPVTDVEAVFSLVVDNDMIAV